jgi:hypothetical protein
MSGDEGRLPKLVQLFVAALLPLICAGSQSATRTANSPLIVTVTSPIKFSVTQGGGAVRSRALELTNTGNAKLEWTGAANQGWLRLEPGSGSLPPKGAASIELVADPAGFAPGIYVASVQISTPTTADTFEVNMTEQSEFVEVHIANAERTFPPDSGMVNIKTQYGAKGDGITDDTAAIQQAISATVHHPGVGARIIYFPVGTYLVSHPLLENDLMGRWSSLLTLQGENRATTIIKLKDNNPLYQNASFPTDVLDFASQNGRKDGSGNSAFDNNIFDMTIDVGRGNPGAVALDYMANNYCALRNVTLQSSDPRHSGAIGLALLRYASGPCLMKNLIINGFDYGIKVANNEYSLTFEDLTLLNQTLYGIDNANNILSLRHLDSRNSVPAIYNENASGLITLIGGTLQSGSSKVSAIQNQGTLYARDITSSGYASVVQGVVGNSITEYDSGPAVTQFGANTSSLNLPVEETPAFEDSSLSNWKSVTAFGADPTGKADSSTAIQAAIDSGATTIYFPTGVYVTTRTLVVRGKVRMLEGFDSSLNPSGETFSHADNPAALITIEAGTADVTINHFRLGAFYAHPSPGVIFLQQDSPRALVLRDSLLGGLPSTIAYQNTSKGTGTLFVENVTGTPWQILFPQNIFARQVNPEGHATKISNNGGKLWILGLKTEGIGTNIETTQGGSTEVLGGLIYPVWKTSADTASFVVTDSRASFIYAVSSYKPPAAGTKFAIQIRETHHGVSKSLPSTSLPARGFGNMMPLYSTADSARASDNPSSKSVPSH